MRILLLSDITSSHTLKWANSLVSNSIEVALFSFSGGMDALEHNRKFYDARIQLHSLGITPDKIHKVVGPLRYFLIRLSYLWALPKIRRLIREFRPDIVHAHYASSYGFLGALSGFHPLIISAWGSDVYLWPHYRPLNRLVMRFVMRFNLSRADRILSTSYAMVEEIAKYTKKNIEVTPFGIDIFQFRPEAARNSLFNENDIVIGTVKSLEETYGIEYLIRAFAILRNRYLAFPLKLLIVGGGSQEIYLKTLAKELGIWECTIFTGKISPGQVSQYQNMLSVYVALSIRESFGVAILEASACEKPVVVSRVGGLPEVVEEGITGLIVPPKDAESAALALEKLILNPVLCRKMGQAGRERVKRLYDWKDNVRLMIDIYNKVSCHESDFSSSRAHHIGWQKR